MKLFLDKWQNYTVKIFVALYAVSSKNNLIAFAPIAIYTSEQDLIAGTHGTRPTAFDRGTNFKRCSS